ncbi:hypothetical protein FN846DRAFT_970586 [Sphaerosporella brunnea]|uniref:Uncharacterized protein n=1 Tax=Sphaerosporella brunnea TaxID=1250544 RepID=A0A5J5EJ93_9PEZI|nr:hypothetical protein FN846DRAFT_970586 [Sphaerosporella brunnea]
MHRCCSVSGDVESYSIRWSMLSPIAHVYASGGCFTAASMLSPMVFIYGRWGLCTIISFSWLASHQLPPNKRIRTKKPKPARGSSARFQISQSTPSVTAESPSLASFEPVDRQWVLSTGNCMDVILVCKAVNWTTWRTRPPRNFSRLMNGPISRHALILLLRTYSGFHCSTACKTAGLQLVSSKDPLEGWLGRACLDAEATYRKGVVPASAVGNTPLMLFGPHSSISSCSSLAVLSHAEKSSHPP